MKKQMSKAVLMKNAWKLAGMKAKELGGKAVEYISYGMKEAWNMYFSFTGKKRASEKKAPKLSAAEKLRKFTALVGKMTEAQENLIWSLLKRGKTADSPIVRAFNISSLRGTITKQQASNLINELLAA